MRYNYPPQFMVALIWKWCWNHESCRISVKKSLDFLHGTIDSVDFPTWIYGRTYKIKHPWSSPMLGEWLVNGWSMVGWVSGKFSWRILQMSHDVKDKKNVARSFPVYMLQPYELVEPTGPKNINKHDVQSRSSSCFWSRTWCPVK